MAVGSGVVGDVAHPWHVFLLGKSRTSECFYVLSLVVPVVTLPSVRLAGLRLMYSNLTMKQLCFVAARIDALVFAVVLANPDLELKSLTM